MVQAEASGKTCFGIGEAQPIDAERAGWGEYDKKQCYCCSVFCNTLPAK